MIKCPMCKQMKPESECTIVAKARSSTASDTYRCLQCNSLHNRIKRATGGDSEFKHAFQSLTDKEAFFKNNHELIGSALKAKILQCSQLTSTTTHSDDFYGSGDYLDEIELKDKYAKRPEVAERIMKNSRSFECQITQRMMYEDVSYKSKSGCVTQFEGKRVLEISAESSRKGAKVGSGQRLERLTTTSVASAAPAMSEKH